MKIWEEYLEKLDLFFENKKESEFFLLVLIIVAFVGYLSYAYLTPWCLDRLKHDLKKQQIVKNMIKDEKDYLASITVNGDQQFKIKKLQQEIKILKKHFNDLKEINTYSDYQIETLSELLFNEKNWAKFLDSIANKAGKNQIDLFMISNKFIEHQKEFGHVLEIGIECEGSYKNIIHFMNDIEESELVVDIYHIDMESNRSIKANFKVSVWGINY